MGYTIIYDRAFIKTNTGILPMVLCGSNNCAEYIVDTMGRQKLVRERRWEHYAADLLNAPKEKFLIWLEANTPDSDTEIFQFHNEWVTGRKFRRWLLNGVESAATLEQYIAWNPGLYLHGMVVLENSSLLYNMAECAERIYTTAHLEEWLERAAEKVKELEARLEQERRNAASDSAPAHSRRVRIDLCFSGRNPLRKIPVSTCEVVAKKGDSYVKSYIKSKELTFTSDPTEAAVFASSEAAAQALGTCWKLRYVSAKNAVKERPFVVRITLDGDRQQYLQKPTARRYYFTGDIRHAKAYPTVNEAQRVALRMESRVVWRGQREIAVCNNITGEAQTLDMEALRAAYGQAKEASDAAL